MRNLVFYFICALIAAAPAFAADKKAKSVSDDVIAKARAAAAAAETGKDSVLLDEATTSLTVGETTAAGEATAVDETAVEAAATTSTEEETKKLSQEEIKNMKESEIPLIGAKQAKKSESSPWFRLLTTFGVVATLLGGALFALKRYGKRANSGTSQGTKIRVVTNHHIGPKKSLMIVNVAGESLLLGVTDQNISILKNLSLLEEELPSDVPNTFAGAINESFVEAAGTEASTAEDADVDDFAVQGLAQIKDKVSSRLKNMRQI